MFFFIHLFIYAYIVWAISPPCPLPSLPHLPCFQAEPVLPFSPILLKSRHYLIFYSSMSTCVETLYLINTYKIIINQLTIKLETTPSTTTKKKKRK
jgi:hypothetical protein